MELKLVYEIREKRELFFKEFKKNPKFLYVGFCQIERLKQECLFIGNPDNYKFRFEEMEVIQVSRTNFLNLGF